MCTQVQPDRAIRTETAVTAGIRRMSGFLKGRRTGLWPGASERYSYPDGSRLPPLLLPVAVGVDHGDLAELEVADRLLDLRQVADHDPGQCVRVDGPGRLGDLLRGQRLDLGGMAGDVVVRTAVLDDVADRTHHRARGFERARQAADLGGLRSEENTSELKSRDKLVCRHQHDK